MHSGVDIIGLQIFINCDPQLMNTTGKNNNIGLELHNIHIQLNYSIATYVAQVYSYKCTLTRVDRPFDSRNSGLATLRLYSILTDLHAPMSMVLRTFGLYPRVVIETLFSRILNTLQSDQLKICIASVFDSNTFKLSREIRFTRNSKFRETNQFIVIPVCQVKILRIYTNDC